MYISELSQKTKHSWCTLHRWVWSVEYVWIYVCNINSNIHIFFEFLSSILFLLMLSILVFFLLYFRMKSTSIKVLMPCCLVACMSVCMYVLLYFSFVLLNSSYFPLFKRLLYAFRMLVSSDCLEYGRMQANKRPSCNDLKLDQEVRRVFMLYTNNLAVYSICTTNCTARTHTHVFTQPRITKAMRSHRIKKNID